MADSRSLLTKAGKKIGRYIRAAVRSGARKEGVSAVKKLLRNIPKSIPPGSARRMKKDTGWHKAQDMDTAEGDASGKGRCSEKKERPEEDEHPGEDEYLEEEEGVRKKTCGQASEEGMGKGSRERAKEEATEIAEEIKEKTCGFKNRTGEEEKKKRRDRSPKDADTADKEYKNTQAALMGSTSCHTLSGMTAAPEENTHTIKGADPGKYTHQTQHTPCTLYTQRTEKTKIQKGTKLIPGEEMKTPSKEEAESPKGTQPAVNLKYTGIHEIHSAGIFRGMGISAPGARRCASGRVSVPTGKDAEEVTDAESESVTGTEEVKDAGDIKDAESAEDARVIKSGESTIGAKDGKDVREARGVKTFAGADAGERHRTDTEVKGIGDTGKDRAKRLLLIMPGFFDYRDEIVREARNAGYETDCINDRPSESTFVKALLRLDGRLLLITRQIYFLRVLRRLHVPLTGDVQTDLCNRGRYSSRPCSSNCASCSSTLSSSSSVPCSSDPYAFGAASYSSNPGSSSAVPCSSDLCPFSSAPCSSGPCSSNSTSCSSSHLSSISSSASTLCPIHSNSAHACCPCSFPCSSCTAISPPNVKISSVSSVSPISSGTSGRKVYTKVLVIPGQSLCFDRAMIKKLRRSFPEAEFILYLWDSIRNYERVKDLFDCFDRILSFDPQDVEEDGRITFLPLFYTEGYGRLREERKGQRRQEGLGKEDERQGIEDEGQGKEDERQSIEDEGQGKEDERQSIKDERQGKEDKREDVEDEREGHGCRKPGQGTGPDTARREAAGDAYGEKNKEEEQGEAEGACREPAIKQKTPDQTQDKASRQEYRAKLLFIGTAHPGKYRRILTISRSLEAYPVDQRIFLYLPSRLLYLYRKCTCSDFRDSSCRMKSFTYRKMQSTEVQEMFDSADIILDSPQNNQRGLTMRCIEAVGAGKKLITTNEDIRSYDFYRPENILVWRREWMREDPGGDAGEDEENDQRKQKKDWKKKQRENWKENRRKARKKQRKDRINQKKDQMTLRKGLGQDQKEDQKKKRKGWQKKDQIKQLYWEEMNPRISAFLATPSSEVPHKILEKYTLRRWLAAVLGEDE